MEPNKDFSNPQMNNQNPQYNYPTQPQQTMSTENSVSYQNMPQNQNGYAYAQQQDNSYMNQTQPQMMGAPYMGAQQAYPPQQQQEQQGALNLGMGYGQGIPQQNMGGYPQQSQPVGMPVNNFGQIGYPQMASNQPSQPAQPIGAYAPPGYAQGQPIEYQVVRPQAVGGGMAPTAILTNLDHCDHPTAFRCTYCQKESISTMTTEPGTGTYTMCCLLCLCSAVLGCIPFCLPECQDKKHFCPYCGAMVGQKEYRPC